ncbi:hypothetical protein [Desulfogranum japonicum]|nr:hypothetical protein [Desulfogranum japonicum]
MSFLEHVEFHLPVVFMTIWGNALSVLGAAYNPSCHLGLVLQHLPSIGEG